MCLRFKKINTRFVAALCNNWTFYKKKKDNHGSCTALIIPYRSAASRGTALLHLIYFNEIYVFI